MIQKKMPPPEIKYVFVEEEIKDWDDFFDKHCEGRRRESGIFTRHVGYLCESTFFWRDEDEYPFGYAVPYNDILKKDSGQAYAYYIKTVSI